VTQRPVDDALDQSLGRERPCRVVQEDEVAGCGRDAGERGILSFLSAFDDARWNVERWQERRDDSEFFRARDHDEFVDARRARQRRGCPHENRRAADRQEHLVLLSSHAPSAAGGEEDGADGHGVAVAVMATRFVPSGRMA
jgi:hypothetical protein